MESGATPLDSGEQVRVALPLSFLFQRRRYQRSQHSMETTDDELHPGLQASTDTRTPHPLKTSLESQRLATETAQGPGFRDCVPAVPPSPQSALSLLLHACRVRPLHGPVLPFFMLPTRQPETLFPAGYPSSLSAPHLGGIAVLW